MLEWFAIFLVLYLFWVVYDRSNCPLVVLRSNRRWINICSLQAKYCCRLTRLVCLMSFEQKAVTVLTHVCPGACPRAPETGDQVIWGQPQTARCNMWAPPRCQGRKMYTGPGGLKVTRRSHGPRAIVCVLGPWWNACELINQTWSVCVLKKGEGTLSFGSRVSWKPHNTCLRNSQLSFVYASLGSTPFLIKVTTHAYPYQRAYLLPASVYWPIQSGG